MSELVGRITGQLPAVTAPVADLRRDAEPLPEAQAPHTLSDMAKDYVFFTTALLAAGGFNRDACSEYARVTDPTLHSYLLVLDFEIPIIPSLGSVEFIDAGGKHVIDFRRRLYAVPHERWEPIKAFISRLTWYDADLFGQSGWGVTTIADTTGRSVVLPLPRVEIQYAVAQTNRGTVCFEQIGDNPPGPVLQPTVDAVLRMAQMVIPKKAKHD